MPRRLQSLQSTENKNQNDNNNNLQSEQNKNRFSVRLKSNSVGPSSSFHANENPGFSSNTNDNEFFAGFGSVKNLVQSYEGIPLKEQVDSESKVKLIRQERWKEISNVMEITKQNLLTNETKRTDVIKENIQEIFQNKQQKLQNQIQQQQIQQQQIQQQQIQQQQIQQQQIQQQQIQQQQIQQQQQQQYQQYFENNENEENDDDDFDYEDDDENNQHHDDDDDEEIENEQEKLERSQRLADEQEKKVQQLISKNQPSQQRENGFEGFNHLSTISERTEHSSSINNAMIAATSNTTATSPVNTNPNTSWFEFLFKIIIFY
jgi:hypothetical protein